MCVCVLTPVPAVVHEALSHVMVVGSTPKRADRDLLRVLCVTC